MPKRAERLTPEQLADGINVAVRNAHRLYGDARLLLKSRRHSSAIALTTLAIEESGKAPILLEMSFVSDDQIDDLWRQLRDHKAKNIGWIFPILAAAGSLSGEIRAQHFDAIWGEQTHALAADLIKQRAIYSEWRDNAWHFPDGDNHPTFAAQFVELARPTIALWKETTPEGVRRYAQLAGPKHREASQFVEAAREHFIAVAAKRRITVRRPEALSCAGQGWSRDFHAEFHNEMEPVWEAAMRLSDEGLLEYFGEEYKDDPKKFAGSAAFLRRDPPDDLQEHLNSYERAGSADGPAGSLPWLQLPK